MTDPPVYMGGDRPHIMLNYTDGDKCSEGKAGQKHSTTVFLTCGPGKSVSIAHLLASVYLMQLQLPE